MAYDEALAERVREALAARRVDEKRMFGGLAFLLAGHMAVAVTRRGLMVRVAPTDAERLLAEPGTGPMTMGDRAPVKGWLLVQADAVEETSALREWVERGVRCVDALPAQR